MNVEFQILSEVDTILFSLLILHGLTDSQGCVWRRHLSQLYTIEVTLLKKVCDKKNIVSTNNYFYNNNCIELRDRSSCKNRRFAVPPTNC